MKEIIINDNVIIQDSQVYPKGRIVIEDQDGKVIVDKENLVVKSGREFIKSLFHKSVDNSHEVEYNIDSIILGTSDIPTTPDMIKLVDRKMRTPFNSIHHNKAFPEDEMFVVYEVEVNDEGAFIGDIKELGINMRNSSDEDMLFSRVVFSGISFVGDGVSKYKIKYYINF